MSYLESRTVSLDPSSYQEIPISSLPSIDYSTLIDTYDSQEAALLTFDIPDKTTEIVPQRPQDPLTQSIYESYNAANEVDYLQKELSHLTDEEKSYYLKENMISYIEEFAGQIRIKKLKGVLTEDGKMNILGSDIADMCRRTAEKAGLDSREALEAKGIDSIIQGIKEGNNRAVWISPPKIADYGFTLTFMVDEYDPALGGRPFRELLLRYPEQMNTVDTSKTVYKQLVDRVGIRAPDSEHFQDYADFLAHPLIYHYDQGYEDMDALYEFLDISPEDIRYSEEFRKQLLPEIEPYIHEYIQLVKQMGSMDISISAAQYTKMEEDANILIGAMFNIGRIVQRRMSSKRKDERLLEKDRTQLQSYRVMRDDRDMLYLAAKNMSSYEKLEITGGSSCPVTQSGGSSNEASFITTASTGLSIASTAQMIGLDTGSEPDGEVCVTCPHCGNKEKNKKIKGKYICGNSKCKSNHKK